MHNGIDDTPVQKIGKIWTSGQTGVDRAAMNAAYNEMLYYGLTEDMENLDQ